MRAHVSEWRAPCHSNGVSVRQVTKILVPRQHWEQRVVLFFNGVVCAHIGGLVGLRWSFFSFFFFFSLMPLKFSLDLPKHLCPQFVVLSILVIFLLITIYLALDAFWNLAFFRFFPNNFIQFNFFNPIRSLYFFILFFSWLIFFWNFIPYHFIAFIF
jgi:hypothetical protein